MKRKYFLHIQLLVGTILVLFAACREEEKNIFTDAPSIRATKSEEALRTILTSQTNGWHMRYFPKIDTTLNADITANLKTDRYAVLTQRLFQRLGVGGYNLFVKFNADGSVQYISDIPQEPTDKETHYFPLYRKEISDSQYEIRTGEDLNLFFSTYTDIDALFGLGINATNRFILDKIVKDTVFLRTAQYATSGYERLQLIPLSYPIEEWKEKMEKIIAEKETFRWRSYLQDKSEIESRICVLEIKSKSSGTIVYRTSRDFGQGLMGDRKSFSYSQDAATDRRVSFYDRVQYELFIKNEEPDKTSSGYDGSSFYTGLGSGYIGTENGIEFYPGFRFDEDIVFRNFIRTNSKEWKCELAQYEAVIKFVEQENLFEY